MIMIINAHVIIWLPVQLGEVNWADRANLSLNKTLMKDKPMKCFQTFKKDHAKIAGVKKLFMGKQTHLNERF